ncbi:MAG: hypothetical protein LBD41_05500 [Clostridiales Family XIII bacterium]|jgi:hypothetical protein|nr:hypothetical protein [Clostridiales Family XIII bacterium]
MRKNILNSKILSFVLVFALFSGVFAFIGPFTFAETYKEGQSLPSEISENSSITGKIRQNSTAKIGSGKTLTIKSGGVLELGADAACINFLLENGGTLIIEKGGELILDYTSDTVVHESGIIYNYGTITNKGSFTIDGATVYNYGTFDNQLWLNLNGGAKIYSAVPINGVNNITPLDSSSEIAQPIEPDDGGGSSDPSEDPGIVIHVDPDGVATGGTISDKPDNPADSGDTPSSGSSNTPSSGSSSSDTPSSGSSSDTPSSGSSSSDTPSSGSSDNPTTDSGGTGDEGNSSSTIDTPTDSGADIPAGSAIADNPENKIPINIVNNIPDDVVIIGVGTSDKNIVQVSTGKDKVGEDSLRNLNVLIPGNKKGQTNYKTFYVSPPANLKDGTYITNLLFQYESPTASGKVKTTLSVPVKINVGENSSKITASTNNAEINGWALLNLIAMIISILLALLSIILLVARNRKFRLYILTALPFAALSIILFFLTENLKSPMVILDKWTGWMALLFVIEFFIIILSKGEKKKLEEKDS